MINEASVKAKILKICDELLSKEIKILSELEYSLKKIQGADIVKDKLSGEYPGLFIYTDDEKQVIATEETKLEEKIIKAKENIELYQKAIKTIKEKINL